MQPTLFSFNKKSHPSFRNKDTSQKCILFSIKIKISLNFQVTEKFGIFIENLLGKMKYLEKCPFRF